MYFSLYRDFKLDANCAAIGIISISYNILAAKEMIEAKDDKKAATACFEKAGLDPELYRTGNTKVFFRAGVLGRLEEIRDDRVALLMSWFQAWIRGFISRKQYSKMQKQRTALLVVQRNIRKFKVMRSWLWYDMWIKLKPKLNVTRAEDELIRLEELAEKAEADYEKEIVLRQELETKNASLLEERAELMNALDSSKGGMSEFMEKQAKLQAQKSELEAQLNDMLERVRKEEEASGQLSNGKKKCEQEFANLKKDLEDLELAVQKGDQDKATKEQQIQNLKEEIAHQEELITKVNKEKKHLQECNHKTAEDVQCIEDKCNHLSKMKTKLESTLDELEDSLEREKKLRSEVEKSKRKVEGDLRLTQEAVSDLERNYKELEVAVERKDKELSALTAKIEDEQALVYRDQRQVKELQARLEELEEDVEHERQARSKAEKAKNLLSREVGDLAERLDEAGGATATQIEINKKRESELAKVRRELEESSLQHESGLAALRKKHNDAVAEMSEQIDYLNKMKARTEKDKDAMKRDAEDARASMDALSRDKRASQKDAP
ncbi:myosin heavy chain, muscle-like [Penaeus vannamei]|uniref:myosin heavy chain, muscle-like n=1 Tax=Penaeus vannamei TaxID=6689 RepID=UPI00387F5997